MTTTLFMAVVNALPQSGSSAPACATTCLTESMSDSGCQTASIQCLCTSQQYISAVTSCVVNSCQQDEFDAALTYAQSLCNGAGVPLSLDTATISGLNGGAGASATSSAADVSSSSADASTTEDLSSASSSLSSSASAAASTSASTSASTTSAQSEQASERATSDASSASATSGASGSVTSPGASARATSGSASAASASASVSASGSAAAAATTSSTSAGNLPTYATVHVWFAVLGTVVASLAFGVLAFM
ncbi:hypothetical protein V1514DRAFT_318751 [Lipomyces japonicus]|uniref:uncharacterized protein n=1 Tax=Lipomyces japonicus TaxID=56871 RepID=UPI0034CFAB9F